MDRFCSGANLLVSFFFDTNLDTVCFCAHLPCLVTLN